MFNFLNFNSRFLKKEFKVICIVESWLESTPILSRFVTENYNCFFSNAVRRVEGGRGRSSGGIVVLCSKQFNVELIHTHRYWIVVKLLKNANTHLFLGAIYFSPCTTHNAGF